MQMLRENPALSRATHSLSSSSSPLPSKQNLQRRTDDRNSRHGAETQSGSKTVKNDGDFKWLEEDDDDDDEGDHHVPSKRAAGKSTEGGSKDSRKKPLTVAEAGKMFFSSVSIELR